MVHAFSAKRITENGTDEIPDQAFDFLPNRGAEHGTEMAMALSQKAAVYVYALLFTPLYYLIEWLWPANGYRGMLIATFVLGLALRKRIQRYAYCNLRAGFGASLPFGTRP